MGGPRGGGVHCHSRKERLRLSLYLCNQREQRVTRNLVWIPDKRVKFRCLECKRQRTEPARIRGLSVGQAPKSLQSPGSSLVPLSSPPAACFPVATQTGDLCLRHGPRSYPLPFAPAAAAQALIPSHLSWGNSLLTGLPAV